MVPLFGERGMEKSCLKLPPQGSQAVSPPWGAPRGTPCTPLLLLTCLPALGTGHKEHGWAQVTSQALWSLSWTATPIIWARISQSPARALQGRGSGAGPRANLPHGQAHLCSPLWQPLIHPGTLFAWVNSSLYWKAMSPSIRDVWGDPCRQSNKIPTVTVYLLSASPVPEAARPINKPGSIICFRDQRRDTGTQEEGHNLSRCSEEPND